MPLCPPLSVTRTPHTLIKASQDHADFSNLRDTLNTYALFKDVAGTISVTHTFTATQDFTDGIVVANGATISGGLTVTGGATVDTLVCPGTTTLNTAALTWPGSNTAGALVNDGAGALSWSTGVGIAGRSRCQLVASNFYGSENDTFSNGDVLIWNHEAVDTDGYHEGVTHPSRATVPVTGTYLVVFTGKFNVMGGAIQNGTVTLSKNGGPLGAGGTMLIAVNGSFGPPDTSVGTLTTVVALTAADYLEVTGTGSTLGPGLMEGELNLVRLV
jgi:hypothetical protein